MILGLHHAQITVPPGAEAAAREFYCHFLGLAEIEFRDPFGNRVEFIQAIA